MSVPIHYINGVITLYLKGKPYQIAQDHPCYGQVKRSLRNASEDELLTLLNADNATQAFLDSTDHGGRATVKDGQVYFEGKVVHNAVATRILEHMKAGLDFTNLLRFLERVSKNPSYQSQQELFDFLDRKGLPVTEDGCFLGYKAVRSDFKDIYSGTIDNSPGRVVKMERRKVDDNRTNHCSYGLHVGALDYVYSYGGYDSTIVVVKVDPEHCVSVPTDCSYQKLRTCQYEVLHEFTGELREALYNVRGEAVTCPVEDDEYDWSFCDGDDEVDDYFDDGDVTSEESDHCDGCDDDGCYGYKPDGRKYHNKRNAAGRFC